MFKPRCGDFSSPPHYNHLVGILPPAQRSTWMTSGNIRRITWLLGRVSLSWRPYLLVQLRPGRRVLDHSVDHEDQRLVLLHLANRNGKAEEKEGAVYTQHSTHSTYQFTRFTCTLS